MKLLFLLAIAGTCTALALPDMGEDGLWRIRFADGTVISAADCATNGTEYVRTESATGVSHVWKTPVATICVTERRMASRMVSYVASVTPHGKIATDLDLPATLRFDGRTVNRLVLPQ